ncbi:hypothetical protein IJ182_03415 [bacterium]|nr:hypothetical protein [bacterium]
MKKKTYLVLAVIYIVMFVAVYGIYIINPFYTDWSLYNYFVENIDTQINFLNFLSYINDKNGIVYATMNAYPNHIGIAYIDFIPLLMVFSKLIVKLFSDVNYFEFQYIGLWGVLSYILIGTLSFNIIKKLTNTNFLCALVGSLFFCFAPIFFERYPSNYALASQWLILLSFLPFIYFEELSDKKLIVYYSIMGLLAIGIHGFYLPVILFNMVMFLIYYYFKRKSLKTIFIILGLFIGIAVTTYLSIGIISPVIPDSWGYRVYTCNINSLINPVHSQAGFSSILFPFLNQLETYNTTWGEGFCYVGGGIIIMFFITILCYIGKYKQSFSDILKNYKLEFIILVSGFIFYYLYSLSLDVTLNDKLLFSIIVPEPIEKLLSIYRCPGRFIWTDVYIIYFCLIIALIKRYKSKIALGILIACFALQIVDISGLLIKFHDKYASRLEYNETLDVDMWNKYYADKKILFSDDIDRAETYKYYAVYLWAIKNHININVLLYSRLSKNEENYYMQHAYAPEEGDMFLFLNREEDILKIKDSTNLKNCYIIDSYIVCTANEVDGLEKVEI